MNGVVEHGAILFETDGVQATCLNDPIVCASEPKGGLNIAGEEAKAM
jgi:hypothetical protein